MTGLFNKISKHGNYIYMIILIYFMFVEFCYAFNFWPFPSLLYRTYKFMGFMGIFSAVLIFVDDRKKLMDPINISILGIYISLIIPYLFNDFNYITAIYELSKHSYWLLYAFLYMYNCDFKTSKKNLIIIGYFFIICTFIAMTMSYVLYINQIMDYKLLNVVYPVIDGVGCNFGIFKRHNIGAPFAVFSIILSFILMKNKSNSIRVFHIFNIIYNIPYLYFSTSRNNQIGLLLFFIISIIAYLVRNKLLKKKTLAISAIMTIPVVCIIIDRMINNKRVNNKISLSSIFSMILNGDNSDLFNKIDKFSSGRLRLWRDSIIVGITHGKKRLLFGVGVENYALNSIVVGWNSITHPHNIFFASFVDTGLFGLFFVIMFFVLLLYKSFKASFINKKDYYSLLYFGIVICTLFMCCLEMYGLYASNCPTSTIMWLIYGFILNHCRNLLND